MDITFRPATLADLPDILDIIAQARDFIHSQGLRQWMNGYPSKELLQNDIETSCSYLLCIDGEIALTCALCFHEEPDYSQIHEGAWQSDAPYGAIHRMAVNPQFQGHGLGLHMVREVEVVCRSRGINYLRVDTHPQNTPMIRNLTKCGFTYRGIIYLTGEDTPGDVRSAYDKVFI